MNPALPFSFDRSFYYQGSSDQDPVNKKISLKKLVNIH
jgi:hypothetical protein